MPNSPYASAAESAARTPVRSSRCATLPSPPSRNWPCCRLPISSSGLQHCVIDERRTWRALQGDLRWGELAAVRVRAKISTRVAL